ncbi:hypothetical protein ACFGWM_03340 [Pasteurella multocida]
MEFLIPLLGLAAIITAPEDSIIKKSIIKIALIVFITIEFYNLFHNLVFNLILK